MTAQSPNDRAFHDRTSLEAFLTANDIAFTTHEHPAVFRVEDGLALKAAMPGLHTKNLFLKDSRDQLWLVSAAQDSVIDLKTLPTTIGSGRLSFGKPDLMLATLGVTPGSVTALGLINDTDHRVRFVLDQSLAEANIVNFHPLTNTATTALSREAVARFLTVIRREAVVVDFMV